MILYSVVFGFRFVLGISLLVVRKLIYSYVIVPTLFPDIRIVATSFPLLLLIYQVLNYVDVVDL